MLPCSFLSETLLNTRTFVGRLVAHSLVRLPYAFLPRFRAKTLPSLTHPISKYSIHQAIEPRLGVPSLTKKGFYLLIYHPTIHRLADIEATLSLPCMEIIKPITPELKTFALFTKGLYVDQIEAINTNPLSG